jgi:hypothetical protein
MTMSPTSTILPSAVATERGVDLLLPLETPRDTLEFLVAACNIGACDCDQTFVSKIEAVDLIEEPDMLRVRISGTDITPDDVLTEMASSTPQLQGV